MFRTCVALGMVMALAFLLAQTPLMAGEAVVTGVIANWQQVKSRVADQAYFQIVHKQEILSANTDREGRAALKSAFPRVAVRGTGGFRVDLAQAPPGEYFIALQRGLATTPILIKDGRPVIIKIPGDFPLHVGNVKLEMPLGLGPTRAHMEVVK